MYRGRTLTLSLPPFTKAVKWLILINAGVFFLMTLMGALSRGLASSISDWLVLIPADVVRGEIWQLVTYSFVHIGIFHILFNMLWLWWFGAQLEMDWGYGKFLEFYFFCVVGAALSTIVVSYTGVAGVSPVTQTAGASGGIFGILMAFGMLYGDQEIWLFPIPFSVRAKYFVAGVVFFTLIGMLSVAGPRHGEPIAYVAHLGGLLFGFLYVKFLRKGLFYGLSERYFRVRNDYYRAKRRRAARKFEVYMRDHGDVPGRFDEYGNYIPPNDKQDGKGKSGWVN